MFFGCFLLFLVLNGCRAAGDPPPPSIQLNDNFLGNQSEAVLMTGTAFTFSCHGNLSVRWSSTAFRLGYRGEMPDPLVVSKSDPRHTGTYLCGYTNRSLEHLDTWIHLYVKDPADPSSIFVSPRSTPDVKEEGQDFLFRCLLTDPSVTNLTFQLDGEARSTGHGLPPGMNVTFDPWRGVLIRNLKISFNGRYVCSGWKHGTEVRSRPVDLRVKPRLHPPSASVSQAQFVHLEGEKFEVTCLTSNPSHSYIVTWTHPHIQMLNVTERQTYSEGRLFKNSTLTLAAVHLSHRGRYTCTAVNEAGVATATTSLRVVEAPYLTIYLQRTNINGSIIKEHSDVVANVSSVSLADTLGANVSTNTTGIPGANNANISSSSKVEVYEGHGLILMFVMEAYPAINCQRWTTPSHINKKMEHYSANSYRSEASLELQLVRQEDRGRYSLHFSSSFFSGVLNIDLQIYRKPSVDLTRANHTLTCTSSGYPLPTILWYICPGVRETCRNTNVTSRLQAETLSQQQNEEESWKQVTVRLSPADDVTVECVAYNHVGVSRHAAVYYEPRWFFMPALIGALTAAVVLFLLLLVVSYKWKQKPKYEIRWKIIESTEGNNYTFVDPAHLPYNRKWEFPRDQLRLGAVLGSGAFGKVVEATAYGLGTESNMTRVAVKMLKPSARSEEREALMSELKILSHLGYHDNIVNLLGACTRGGPMLMITEYCCHGDLLNFLRIHAQDLMAAILSGDEVVYKNTVANHTRLRSDSGISCCSEYQDTQLSLSPVVRADGLSVDDLMTFSLQVAQGLNFLSSRNCIHRDVAARNVLLTDRRVAKICDFGLARDIRNDDSYIVQGNARLPVKWMAPESIFQCLYTVQSDVWSYGVLLWEIFSLGKSPYPNVAVDTNFYKMIKDGHHMAQPDFAPSEMYQLMTHCWSLEPTNRPTFKSIGQLIKRLLPSTTHMLPQNKNELMYRNINEGKEEEEVRGQQTQKRGEDEEGHVQKELRQDEEEELPMRNIYTLS
ncbi:macrophage colony-stimulating factor 1 receptor 2 [Thalassophryne amazonica]|uniref:macrophage colony-stimulating factor 1 receptor 2 n=1 Tax=Thalassophryne amazonica TaxID=390379 RepID=UPI0014719B30|nr:macrophage colony-stimulating factor 1 receptor 2 [Thalassophryne amazonica]